MVEAVTDNRNRTVAEVRHQFSKHGGNLGESGCVAWMFDKRGYLAFEASAMTEEEFMELALELDVDDLGSEEEGHELFTSPERYLEVREAVAAKGLEPVAGEIAMLPKNWVDLPEEKVQTVLKLRRVQSVRKGILSHRESKVYQVLMVQTVHKVRRVR